MVDPAHLLELARREINHSPRGAPRQSELCRAVSTAYYAAFHGLMAEVAATFATVNQPVTRILFYRGLEHGKTRERCNRLSREPLADLDRGFFGRSAFAPELQLFSNAFVALQEALHLADYDPAYRVSRAEARDWVDRAEEALQNLHNAEINEKSEFLAYLLLGRR